jgi:hypothetical protein
MLQSAEFYFFEERKISFGISIHLPLPPPKGDRRTISPFGGGRGRFCLLSQKVRHNYWFKMKQRVILDDVIELSTSCRQFVDN